MNKIAKSVAAIVLAGAMCAGLGVAAGCNKGGGEGKSAYEIAVENGFKGTEAEWLESLKQEGKSAYEIAVENGFKGTEAEWLESLKVTEQTTVESCDVSYSVNEYGNRVATFTFTMSDGTTQTKTEVLPASVVNVDLASNTVIWTKAEIESKNYNLAGLNWHVTYDNGYSEFLPLTKDQILEVVTEQENNDSYYRDGMYNVSVIFNSVWGTKQNFEVFAVDNLEAFNQSNQAQTEVSQTGYFCRVGETFGLNNVFVQNYYGEISVTRHYGEGQTEDSYIYPVRYQAVTAEMFDKAIDTSTVGRKEYVVTVGEGNSAIKKDVDITVYDRGVTNVSGINFRDEVEYTIAITAGDDIAAAAKTAYKDKKIEIYYYEPVNGEHNATDTITEAMLDWSAVDANTPGNYYMTITVQGYVQKMSVRVNPDMSNANVTKTVTGEGLTVLYLFMEETVVTKADLYDNGYAVIYTNGGGEDVELTQYVGYLPYTLENNVLTIKYGSENLAIFSVDGNTFGAYDFGEAQATYTGTWSMNDAPFTLKTYSNGFAQMIFTVSPEQSITVILGYTKDGNVLNIAPSEEMGLKLTIGEGNVVTDNIDDIF